MHRWLPELGTKDIPTRLGSGFTMFQYLIAELALGLVLSLIPQKVRSLIGGLIMAVGAVLLLLGMAIVALISDDLAFLLGGCVGLVGLSITGFGWWIRSVKPLEPVDAMSVANTVIDI